MSPLGSHCLSRVRDVFTGRRLHHSLRRHADRGGDAPALAGARPGAEAESWSCRSLEAGKSSSNLNVKLIQP